MRQIFNAKVFLATLICVSIINLLLLTFIVNINQKTASLSGNFGAVKVLSDMESLITEYMLTQDPVLTQSWTQKVKLFSALIRETELEDTTYLENVEENLLLDWELFEKTAANGTPEELRQVAAYVHLNLELLQSEIFQREETTLISLTEQLKQVQLRLIFVSIVLTVLIGIDLLKHVRD